MKTQFLVLMSFSLIAFSSMTSAQGSSPSLPTNASPQIVEGAKLYQSNCSVCHGVNGRDAVAFPRPIWGQGQDIKKFLTAKGLFDYLQMLMPFDDPNKINDQQKTAITAFMLLQNGNVPATTSLPLGGDGTPIK
jgi:mono/diheme cytochrome c family protein